MAPFRVAHRTCRARLAAACPWRPAGATSPASEPIAIAVLDLDYVDTSGEARDQQKEHAARLQRFAAGLRQDLAGSGKYRIVYPACDPLPAPPPAAIPRCWSTAHVRRARSS